MSLPFGRTLYLTAMLPKVQYEVQCESRKSSDGVRSERRQWACQRGVQGEVVVWEMSEDKTSDMRGVQNGFWRRVHFLLRLVVAIISHIHANHALC